MFLGRENKALDRAIVKTRVDFELADILLEQKIRFLDSIGQLFHHFEQTPLCNPISSKSLDSDLTTPNLDQDNHVVFHSTRTVSLTQTYYPGRKSTSSLISLCAVTSDRSFRLCRASAKPSIHQWIRIHEHAQTSSQNLQDAGRRRGWRVRDVFKKGSFLSS
ncbi:hypothetical protein NW759_001288 [Fusarium solani]|nr:hypothetical protein NW759_001288 [Fusarium solani]